MGRIGGRRRSSTRAVVSCPSWTAAALMYHSRFAVCLRGLLAHAYVLRCICENGLPTSESVAASHRNCAPVRVILLFLFSGPERNLVCATIFRFRFAPFPPAVWLLVQLWQDFEGFGDAMGPLAIARKAICPDGAVTGCRKADQKLMCCQLYMCVY